jgi:hypothetical protein
MGDGDTITTNPPVIKAQPGVEWPKKNYGKIAFSCHWWIDNLLRVTKVRAPSRTPVGPRTFI